MAEGTERGPGSTVDRPIFSEVQRNPEYTWSQTEEAVTLEMPVRSLTNGALWFCVCRVLYAKVVGK